MARGRGKDNAKIIRESKKEIIPISLKKKNLNRDFFKLSIKERKEIFLETYMESRGLITITASVLGISTDAIENMVKKYPELKEKMEIVQEANLDRAENALWKLIDDGNFTATIFYLKCKGKKRGYIERDKSEIENAIENGASVDIHFKLGGGNINLDSIDDAKITE